jgi:hypothetical protein
MFLSTGASTSQWERSVFVSLIKAPALMILDEYGAEDRSRFSLFGCVRLVVPDFRSIAILGIMPFYARPQPLS